jgi:hypothetical protein
VADNFNRGNLSALAAFRVPNTPVLCMGVWKTRSRVNGKRLQRRRNLYQINVCRPTHGLEGLLPIVLFVFHICVVCKGKSLASMRNVRVKYLETDLGLEAYGMCVSYLVSYYGLVLILSGSPCPFPTYGKRPMQGYTRHVHSINLSLRTLFPHQALDHFLFLVLFQTVTDLLLAVFRLTRANGSISRGVLLVRPTRESRQFIQYQPVSGQVRTQATVLLHETTGKLSSLGFLQMVNTPIAHFPGTLQQVVICPTITGRLCCEERFFEHRTLRCDEASSQEGVKESLSDELHMLLLSCYPSTCLPNKKSA